MEIIIVIIILIKSIVIILGIYPQARKITWDGLFR